MKEIYKLITDKNILDIESIQKFAMESEFEEVIDVVTEIFTLSNTYKRPEIDVSLFNFSASFTLSGGPYPCESIECRFNRLDELAKFSTLYSDNITIYNPFDFVYFYLLTDGKKKISEIKFRTEALMGFLILLEFQPLLERGIVNFSKTMYTLCPACKVKREKNIDEIYADLEEIGKNSIFPLIKDSVQIKYHQRSFNLEGIEDLIGETLYIKYKKFPHYLVKDGNKIKNFRQAQYTNPIIQKVVAEAIDSLVFQKIGGIENLTRTYLTTNLLEKTFLEKIGKDSGHREFNFLAKGLPIINATKYENILEIRDRNITQFKSFQNYVSELMKKANNFETQEEFNTYVEKELREHIKELREIHNKETKKLIFKTLGSGFLKGFGAVSIAVSTSSNYVVPALLGILETYRECSNIHSDLNKIVQETEQNPLFFYYKLEQELPNM